MKWTFLCLVLFILVSGEVESACDPDVITKINSLWGDNSPKGVLDQLVGSLTYLYVPEVLKSATTGFKCIKTVLEEDVHTAVDYHMYENADDVKAVKYFMSENVLNITRAYSTDGSSSDDYVHPVYLKNGVFGFWQCRHDYESFINIAVLNYGSRKEEEDVKEAITEAETQLKQLGIEFYSKSPDC